MSAEDPDPRLRSHSRPKVALAAVRGDKTLTELAQQHDAAALCAARASRTAMPTSS